MSSSMSGAPVTGIGYVCLRHAKGRPELPSWAGLSTGRRRARPQNPLYATLPAEAPALGPELALARVEPLAGILATHQMPVLPGLVIPANLPRWGQFGQARRR